MKYFLINYPTEFIKTKNSVLLWIIITGSSLVPLMLLITYLYNWELFIPSAGQNPWYELFARSFNGLALFTPLFIILLTAIHFSIESKANSWKHLFTMPVPKSAICSSKLIFLITIVIFYLIAFTIETLLAGFIAGTYKTDLKLTEFTPDWKSIFLVLFKYMISSLAPLAIQFWLAIRLKNMLGVIGIGLTGIAIAILFNSKSLFAVLWPYSYHLLMLNYDLGSKSLEIYHVASLIYFALFTVGSFYFFTRRFKY